MEAIQKINTKFGFHPTHTTGIVVIVLAIGLVVTLYSVQQSQEQRSRASGVTTSTVTLNTTGDTYIASYEPNEENSTSSSIRVKGSTHSVGLLKFNLGVLPAGATVTSAALKLHTNTEDDSSTDDHYQIVLMSNTSWPYTVTWNNRPSFSGSTVGVTSSSSVNRAYTYTLNPASFTPYVGRTAALAILDPNYNYNDGTWFYGDRTSYPPQLVITYSYGSNPTATPILTATPVPPTNTPTPLPTAVPTSTPYPTNPPTHAPTPTPTYEPVLTPIPTVLPTSLPTATPVPGNTSFAVTLGLHGIGTGGDSASPNSHGNMTPNHPQRDIAVQIFNAQNQLVADTQGSVTFDNASGKFSGNIDLGSQFASGVYTVKIKTDQFLRGLVNGIQTITAHQVNTLPSVTLVNGDMNGDNQINIVDYNLLIGCYSDLLPAVDCTPANNLLTDLNDDGHVNQFDYNLFLRELTNIGGQ